MTDSKSRLNEAPPPRARNLGALPEQAVPALPLVVVLGPASRALTVFEETMRVLGEASRDALGDRPLGEHDQAVLHALGAGEVHPSASLAGPPSERSLTEILGGLSDCLGRIEREQTIVLRHSELSGLLPLLRKGVDRPIIALLVFSSPAAETEEECDDSPILRLARYEHSLRQAISNLSGLPVFVCQVEAASNSPEETAGELAAFLGGYGLDENAARELFSGALHELGPSSDSAASSTVVLEEIEAMYASLSKQHGPNPCFGPLLDERESPWASEVLRLSGDLGHLVDALLWSSKQLESIVRASPPPEIRPARTEPDELSDDETEPSEDGPYPLSASEDRRAYHRWLAAHRQPVAIGSIGDATVRRALTRAPLFARRAPLISVLVPVWRTPLWALQRCIGSVLAQSFADWELCICDDASGDEELRHYLSSIKRVDRRIKVTALEQNGGISRATNAALAMANGQFVAFLDHDDELTPDALKVVAESITNNPEADVFYSDEDKIDSAGERFDPAFKPEWSPDLLLSFAYLCHLTVIRRDLVNELGGLRPDYDGSQDYDLSLRATEKARQVVHISRLLYHWRTLPGSAATDSPGAIAKPWAYEAGRRAIIDALARRGETGEVTAVEAFPGRYHVRRSTSARPLVSIIIPFRDEPGLLATCATSLRRDPGYDRIELVLVDNGSELPETEALLERLGAEPNVTILRSPGPFNWAAINNAAAREAKGEVLVFANNDIEARAGRWLDALLGHALRAEVGAVGARLVYPDGAIQHAGVVIGLGGIAGHVLRGLPSDHPGYNSMAIQTRNCSVVTGACMMTRREVFEEVGGFDEQLPVAFNDVDYCLKLRKAGYLVVYTPLAELVHHESRSRGHTDDLMESKLILRRWADEIAAGDPYMSVHLSHWRYWCPLSTAQEDERWKTYLKTSVLTRGSSSNT